MVRVGTLDYAARMPLPPRPDRNSRRTFVASVGAALVAGSLPTAPRRQTYSDAWPERPRGLALHRNDCRFHAGLTYRHALLTRHRVVVKVAPGNWFHGYRISTHLFNDLADVEALTTALRTEFA